jgi:glucan phosphoethanolaminetransferase (alkaline phosphatase superfamily)
MRTFLLTSCLVLIVELFLLWWIKFYEDSFFKTYENLKFWSCVASGLVCFYSFGKSSVITETRNNEIIREVFIGKEA